MPPPAASSPSPINIANASSPSSDNNDNPPSSKDSEGYPSWLPKRPPPPPPTSTLQSSMIGGFHDTTPSPVDPPFIGGRKPTPRSVRIVSLEDSFVGAVEKETRFTRKKTDQTRMDLPPKVLARASTVLPAAFNASEHDEFLPLPQPRFNANNLHLQLLRNPSRWMKLYFYLWPLIVLYHIPLQSFFDFNAVFILFFYRVSLFPNSPSSGKNWELAAAAYIACWLVWIFIICLVYELVYSFVRRWRMRRPLMLPIYLSSSAFNYAAMTSYNNFSFLQHLRFSAFFPEPANPQSPSDPEYDAYYDSSQSPWKSGIAETCFFYSQNLPTVAMLLPRAGLSMALLFAFSSPPAFPTTSANLRDQTFFRSDGSLTDYSRGILFANAAWTGWRLLVFFYRLGLWIMSRQGLAGLCGPRHTWEESDQEKSRSIYSEAVSECGPYRSSFYQDGDALDYAGDELPWGWREATRMRVQDAFEFCLTSSRGGTGTTGSAGLRWSSVSSNAVHGSFGHRNRRYMDRHRRSRSGKDKELSNEKSEFGAENDEGFEGIEKVLAAVGFPSTASPSRRGVLSEDLFAAPASFIGREPQKQEYPTIEPLRYRHDEPGPSTGMFTDLEPPMMAKRSSKDKIPGSSTTVGEVPLLNLPYPFSKPGSGQVSSNDLVLFPTSAKPRSKKSQSSNGAKTTSKSGTSTSKSTSITGSTIESREEEEDDDDDDEDDDEEGDDLGSEEPSEPASGSMSSLGHPISPIRYAFGTRRPGAGHRRTQSGVSSGMSSGAAISGGSHAHSDSMSSDHQQRRRADSGRGIMINPVVPHGSDIVGQHEFNEDDLNELPDDDDDLMVDDDNEDEHGELEDRVGLLSVPSASHSGVSLPGTHSSSSGSLEARSRTHSSLSIHSSRSRHSSTRARSRSRTHSSHGSSVRERASSLGTSMRSLVRSTTASVTQLDLILRGATGPAAGLGVGGSRPRSRVNSSMARLEEDDHEMLPTTSAVPAAAGTGEMNERRVSGGSGNVSNDGSAEVAVSDLMVGRSKQELEEGYSSSGGTHSRSASEMSGENYTFGRPVLFMKPVQEQQDRPQDLAEDEVDEVVLFEKSNRGSPNRSVPTNDP